VKYYLLKPFAPEYALAIFRRVLERHPVVGTAAGGLDNPVVSTDKMVR
jgi:hypothetical protein